MCARNVRTGKSMVSRRLAAMVALAVVAPLALAACGKDERQQPSPASWVGSTPPSAAPSQAAVEQSAPAGVSVTISPAAGTKDVPVSTEISVQVQGGTVESVALRDDDGKDVSGAMREDGSAWV